MNRKDISGFQLSFFGYVVEVVTIRYIPVVFAISTQTGRIIYRTERKTQGARIQAIHDQIPMIGVRA